MRKVGKSIFYENEPEEEGENEEVKKEDERIQEEENIEKARYDILLSEAEYLGYLRVLTETYIKPLAPLLSEEEARQLFGYVPQVIECSERLLGELCLSWKTEELYTILQEAATTYLTVYVPYCTGLPNALSLLTKLIGERRELQEAMAESEGDGRGIGLQSYLLKPFQRLTRLPLLLEPLEKAGEAAAREATLAITRLIKECDDSVETVTPRVTPSPSTSEESVKNLKRSSSSFYVKM